MNGVDNSKSVAREREYFRDAAQKNKEAADRRVAEMEAHTESKMSNQKDSYAKDRAQLEKNFQDNIEHLKNKNAESSQDSTKSLQEDIAKERESFSKSSRLKSNEFDKRLGEIKNSYQKSFDAEKEGHEEAKAYASQKNREVLNDMSQKTSKDVKGYQEKMSKSNSELKAKSDSERRDLTKAHEDQLSDQTKAATRKQQEMGQRLRKDVASSLELAEEDAKLHKQYAKDKMNSNMKLSEERIGKLANDFSERSQRSAESTSLENERLNVKHSQEKNDLERAFNKKMSLADLEKRRRDNNSSSFNAVSLKQQGVKDSSDIDKRIDELKGRYDESRTVYENKLIQDKETFRNSFKKETTEATARLDKKLGDANKDKILAVTEERLEAEHNVENLAKQNASQAQGSVQELNTTKKSASDRLNKVKQDFNSTMTTLEEKHKISMDDVSKTAHKEKTEFMKKVTESQSKEVLDLKRDFGKTMDSTILDYEQRLNNLSRENQNLKVTMDEKLNTIMDVTDKKLEAQKHLYEGRRTADLQGQQAMVDQKEYDYKKSINQINVNFQKKFDKMQAENDSKLKLLTSDYENKLKTMKSESTKELTQTQNNQQVTLDRMKSNFLDEKNRLIASYDEQITSLKASNEEKLTQARNYKSLS